MKTVNQPTGEQHLPNQKDENTVSVLEQDLLRREEREPLPDDLITVSPITPDSPEYQQLVAAGLTDEELGSRRIPRHKLVTAGFAFVNRLYLPSKGEDMQKPLINVTLNGIDFGKRTLLTNAELQMLAEHQKQENPTTVSPTEIREDMLTLMVYSYMHRHRNLGQRNNSFLLARHELDPEERAQFDEFGEKWKVARGLNKQSPITCRQEFLKEFLPDIYPWDTDESAVYPKVRGIPTMKAPFRANTLEGIYSPFLDSGFKFPDYTFDLQLEPSNLEEGRRLNIMVWHLASRGLSEAGRSPGKATDQTYMSLADHYHLFFEGLTPDEVRQRNIKERNEINLTTNVSEDEILTAMANRYRDLMAKGLDV